MRTAAQRVGDQAEDEVVARLRTRGWMILGQRIRVGRAEIDILAVDPGPPRTLVVVEVRMRGRRDFGLPEETISSRKIHRLWGAVQRLRAGGGTLNLQDVAGLPARVDLVAVERATPAGFVVRHHRALG